MSDPKTTAGSVDSIHAISVRVAMMFITMVCASRGLPAAEDLRYPPTVRNTVDFDSLFEDRPRAKRVLRFDEITSEPPLSLIDKPTEAKTPSQSTVPPSKPPFKPSAIKFDAGGEESDAVQPRVPSAKTKRVPPLQNRHAEQTQSETQFKPSANATTAQPAAEQEARMDRASQGPALTSPKGATLDSQAPRMVRIPSADFEPNDVALRGGHELPLLSETASTQTARTELALPARTELAAPARTELAAPARTGLVPQQLPIGQTTTLSTSVPVTERLVVEPSVAPSTHPAVSSHANVTPSQGGLGENIAQEGPSQRWWERQVTQTLRTTQRQHPISLNSLLVSALANSAQIQLISDAPLISETEITAADAAFDWTSFVDARWDDISDPVGNTLTTGGPDRLRDHNATVEMGVRRRNTIGGEFEIGQRLGHQNNNSIFFLPQNQGSSQLTLSYTQPLLRGSGRVYNTSLTVLAQLRTKLDRKEFESQLQDHLLSITQEYWTLYFERSRYLQNQRLLANGEKVLAELKSREEVDALKSQVVRARAAVENRRAQLVRSRLSIRMAEARIRALVNDPGLGDTLSVEMIPQEQMLPNEFPVDINSAVSTALQSRPEIEAAIQQVKSASVRMNMGKREALPLLNVVLETYASGLEGNSKVGRAWKEQFTEGEPTYGIGLQYEYPIWNRAASSRIQKRRLELRRLQHQFRQTVESMKLEVELAVHQVHAAYESLSAKQRAMEAANDEVAYLYDRWLLLPVDNGSASLLLEDLLEAQDRLAESELGMLQALLDHNLAQVEFKRAVGSLLENNQVTIDRNCNCNLPQQQPVQNQPLQFQAAESVVLPPFAAAGTSTFDAPKNPTYESPSLSRFSPPTQTRPIWNDPPSAQRVPTRMATKPTP